MPLTGQSGENVPNSWRPVKWNQVQKWWECSPAQWSECTEGQAADREWCVLITCVNAVFKLFKLLYIQVSKKNRLILKV